MGRILSMAGKDLRLLWRDRAGLFWVLAFPILMAVFFGSIFGSGGSGRSTINVAVVKESPGEMAEAIARNLETSTALSVARMDRDSAQYRVQKGRLSAYVALTEPESEGGFAGMIGMPAIEIGIDPSRRAEAAYLQGITTQAYFTVMQSQFTDPVKTRALIDDGIGTIDTASSLTDDERDALSSLLGSLSDFQGFLLEQDNSADSSAGHGGQSPFASPDISVSEITRDVDFPRSAFEITFPQGLTWGLLAVTITFALSLVQERQRGTYLRLRIAPIGNRHILAGKAVAAMTASVLVSVILLGIGVLIMGVRIEYPLGLLIAVLSSSVCFAGLVMFISVLGKTENAVAGAGWAIMMVLAMTGGGMIPLMMMPKWMSTISNISPIKWTIYSLEGAIWRGFGLQEMLLPAGILIGVGVVCYTIGVTIVMRQEV